MEKRIEMEPGEKVNNVVDFITICAAFRERLRDRVLYFRGEPEFFAELRPSVMRMEKGRFPYVRSEGKLIVELMSRRPEEFERLNTALAHWVLARHHGLPTRLLDITRNPLVALFHACHDRNEASPKDCGRIHVFGVPEGLIKPFNSDSISVIANFAKLSCKEQKQLLGKRKQDSPSGVDPGGPEWGGDYQKALMRLYHFIGQEKPHFQERIDPRDFFRVFVVEPQQSFERIRAQSGAFIISAFHERLDRSEILEQSPGTPVYDHYTIEVPKTKKQAILDELRLLNITRETLLPGIDEAARAVTKRFEESADSCSNGK